MVMKMLIVNLLYVYRCKILLKLLGKNEIYKIWDKLDMLICLLLGD